MRTASRLQVAVRTAPNPAKKLVALRYLLARVSIDETVTVRHARKAGLSWAEIAEHLGVTESGARKRYTRRGIS